MKRRQRANLHKDPVRLAAAQKKDRERKQKSRPAHKKHLKEHPRLLKSDRETKKLQMREYRRKKKVAEQTTEQSAEVEPGRATAAKQREACIKDRLRKQNEILKKKLEEAEKKKSILRVNAWRMKIKLKRKEPEGNRGAHPFSSPSSEQRAVRKAKHTLPRTPQRRARVLEKLVESPTQQQILEKKGVLLTKKTRRTLEMSEVVMQSLSEQIDEVKPTGGASTSKRTAFGILKSIVDKKMTKRARSALYRTLKLRREKKQKNDRQGNQWWRP